MMELKSKNLLWLLSVLIVSVTYCGFASAGGLESSALSGQTIRATKELQPAWSKKIKKASKRFQIVLDGAGVLDKETGLVWEKSPDTEARTWADAVSYAYTKSVGGRKGWRLPTIEELSSLVDPTQNSPALPSDHPFTNVQSDSYWSSTTNVSLTSAAWHVYFDDGYVGDRDKAHDYYVWCVRGGHGYDAY
ncbi:hypothetical protein BIY37_02880 [Candidatus Brocadia sapporoensis]|uniref:Lcl C-terminal domain-containing protein n=1 Tax=Candidatus Brocadia sapporoensis TaxID=392547 RepID=A0A1V6M287_9BACT|nr:DUF1566 domain-containing protein [Candidatus Brocadia sapporoensis]MDG6004832.1 DUF1566 domain-containing protein [Candidatus Brocadia sp.]OQD46523.1 hypothetical protein BIY37_02880 [Candidatus Brocadia sapporoensis]GJQ22553.1 MAG: hypothetical protein HBSAPP01_03430 [Candidatus Brocadia sapporoensis]